MHWLEPFSNLASQTSEQVKRGKKIFLPNQQDFTWSHKDVKQNFNLSKTQLHKINSLPHDFPGDLHQMRCRQKHRFLSKLTSEFIRGDLNSGTGELPGHNREKTRCPFEFCFLFPEQCLWSPNKEEKSKAKLARAKKEIVSLKKIEPKKKLIVVRDFVAHWQRWKMFLTGKTRCERKWFFPGWWLSQTQKVKKPFFWQGKRETQPVSSVSLSCETKVTWSLYWLILSDCTPIGV